MKKRTESPDKTLRSFESAASKLARELDTVSTLKKLIDPTNQVIEQFRQMQDMIDQQNRIAFQSYAPLLDQMRRDAERSNALAHALYGNKANWSKMLAKWANLIAS